MNFRHAAAAAAILVSSLAAQAAPITVQGITWDPESTVPMDFQANGAPAYQWFQNSAAFNPLSAITFDAGNIGSLAGKYLSGAANVSQLNGVTNAGTFAPGRELTYVFGGIQITSVNTTVISPTLTLVSFGFDVSQSFFRVYSDASRDYTFPTVSGQLADQSKAGNTDFAGPFLEGVFNTFSVNTGLLTSDGVFSGNAAGLISITGGAAGTNFDTNTIGIPGSSALADLSFTGSTQITNNSRISNVGSTDFQGDSRAIPEPSSLALVGLALAGIGATFNRRKLTK